MKQRLKHCIAFVVASAAHFTTVAHGADAPSKRAAQPQPDVQFLEYLGTLEGDDENWTDVAKGDVVTIVSDTRNTAGKASLPKQTAQNSEAASREAESK